MLGERLPPQGIGTCTTAYAYAQNYLSVHSTCPAREHLKARVQGMHCMTSASPGFQAYLKLPSTHHFYLGFPCPGYFE